MGKNSGKDGVKRETFFCKHSYGGVKLQVTIMVGDTTMGSGDFSSKEQSLWRDCRKCGGRRVGDTCGQARACWGNWELS